VITRERPSFGAWIPAVPAKVSSSMPGWVKARKFIEYPYDNSASARPESAAIDDEHVERW
jgi:hypothetical protein